MSRIVVKNLPVKITEDRIREIFSKKGTLTDVQMKLRNGKFRGFAFLGFKTEKEAQEAMSFYNGTFVNSSKIKIELCANLGDPNKPRAWSKYSKESSAYKKAQQGAKPQPATDLQGEKKNSKEKSGEPLVLSETHEKVKDDPQFAEFLEVHKNRKNKVLWSNDAGGVGEDEQELAAKVTKSEKKKNKKDATTKGLSDLDYLKSKMVKGESSATADLSDENSAKNVKKRMKKSSKGMKGEFALTMKGLPIKCKKSSIKKFFHPMELKDIRMPNAVRGMGIAFVDFKTEKDMNKALARNKGFLDGRRVYIHRHIPPEKRTANDKQNAFSTSYSKFSKLEEDLKKTTETIAESGRIFVRNLSYTVTEEDLENLFKPYGLVSEVRLPIERVTRKVKGFAFVEFLFPEHAAKAHAELDGKIFQGRILHILPSKGNPGDEGTEQTNAEGSSFKKQKAAEEKAQSGSSHNWNALFLGANAVADVVAKKYNTTKQEMLLPDSNESVAVRMALGETQIVVETRNFLMDNGIELDAFSQADIKRSKTVILVKNLPSDTPIDELRNTFSKYGEVGRVIFPPSGITAVVEFLNPTEAKRAFKNLAYAKFFHIPLYLEWAPVKIFKPQAAEESAALVQKDAEATEDDEKKEEKKEESDEEEDEWEPEDNTTIFVKNLDLETTEESLRAHFEKCGRLHSVSVSKKKDIQNPGTLLSMGYGFVQFLSAANAQKALKTMQHSALEGSVIELKLSNRTVSSNEVKRKSKSSKATKQKSSKILVRNIPFEATIKEITKLFSTFGEFKAIRLPMKMGGTGHRGFGFVDFLNKKDAKRAFEALCHSTHLFGRRLVLEWAETDDASVDTIRRKTAQHFHNEGGPPAPKRLRKAAILEQLEVGDENH